MKILTILGARPQFIKASSQSKAFKKYPEIQEIILHTGQHYDFKMSQVFFSDLDIPKPTFFLKSGGKTHAKMTGEMMEGIEKIILKIKPDRVLVYGDTNSTLAGALSAAKLHIPIIHIEAGLRSFNIQMPEEINRILTDRISSLLFCPTQNAYENLKKEGFLNFPCKIHISGDVMLDSIKQYSKYAKKPNIPLSNNFVLATIHRAENTNDIEKLKSIFDALEYIGREVQVILPLHPRVAKILKHQKINTSNISFIDPLGYLEMIWLLQNTQAVFTDSGGLQKEAYFFSKPCFVLREESEWVELTKNNCNILVGADKEKIISCFGNISDLFARSFPKNLFGDGCATELIAKTILE
ncbi:non-hydrolyzing UDP-N-acetylglucosamine 2-epimerase [Helicobacter cappadocius]|uniref:UDP-N-acetylglucosamine 2-epimerase (Non-hydrolyzing) n=1 Tax=Helicobacter cappadocius TaxID=3063998 RepID=A0AA90PY55_9HELI|nr:MULTISPECIES: UDP-N-acetylglucosamine 2-epimerase (non-hydrolyzing) [unclassified Helicobacter]MDO7253803.1 UDP-N-acetylglucosamine 2-epimerase (non-hydrolyzing) [Helicobacter sp. faydin-H75]MDP2538683.1 UDP-N-acetylglucosamine 2-epimerase (non-hydrolyzing) [Helicobacter sp. faydin-H76]